MSDLQWAGQPVDEMSKEELIEALEECYKQITSMFERHKKDLDFLMELHHV